MNKRCTTSQITDNLSFDTWQRSMKQKIIKYLKINERGPWKKSQKIIKIGLRLFRSLEYGLERLESITTHSIDFYLLKKVSN